MSTTPKQAAVRPIPPRPLCKAFFPQDPDRQLLSVHRKVLQYNLGYTSSSYSKALLAYCCTVQSKSATSILIIGSVSAPGGAEKNQNY
jgi:hypothetical protein